MALRDNFRPVVQGSSSYNPVTLTGEGVPMPERAHGVRIVAAGGARTGNLQGAACMPLETASTAPGMQRSISSSSSNGSPQLLLSARVDHLCGGACAPAAPEAAEGSPGRRQPHSHKAAALLTLRAAVDHLSGEACTVRHVNVVATTDAVPATLARGMPTKLTKDRRAAQEAKDRMTNSKLYSLGQGYTEAVDGRNLRPSESRA